MKRYRHIHKPKIEAFCSYPWFSTFTLTHKSTIILSGLSEKEFSSGAWELIEDHDYEFYNYKKP